MQSVYDWQDIHALLLIFLYVCLFIYVRLFLVFRHSALTFPHLPLGKSCSINSIIIIIININPHAFKTQIFTIQNA